MERPLLTLYNSLHKGRGVDDYLNNEDNTGVTIKNREFGDIHLFYMGQKSFTYHSNSGNLEVETNYHEMLMVENKRREVKISQMDDFYLWIHLLKFFSLKIPIGIKKIKTVERLEEKLSKFID